MVYLYSNSIKSGIQKNIRVRPSLWTRIIFVFAFSHYKYTNDIHIWSNFQTRTTLILKLMYIFGSSVLRHGMILQLVCQRKQSDKPKETFTRSSEMSPHLLGGKEKWKFVCLGSFSYCGKEPIYEVWWRPKRRVGSHER